MTNAFAGAADHPMQEGHPRIYHYEGDHVVKVLAFKEGLTRDNRVFFGCDLKLLADPENPAEAASTNPTLRPGMLFSWATVKNSIPKYYFTEIRKALHVMTDLQVQAADIDEAMMKKSVSPEQPYAGKIVVVRVFPKFNLKTGEPKMDRATGKQMNTVSFEMLADSSAYVDLPPSAPAPGTLPLPPRVEGGRLIKSAFADLAAAK